MSKRNRRPSLPGDILRELYLYERDITLAKMSNDIGTSLEEFCSIVHGSSPVTPEIAVSWAAYLDTSPTLWLNLQKAVDDWDAANS